MAIDEAAIPEAVPVAVRDEWIDHVKRLLAEVEAWARAQNWSTRWIEIRVDDPDFKSYPSPALLLQKEATQAMLGPGDRSRGEDDGIVDLCEMPAYDDVARLFSRENIWYIRALRPGQDPARPGIGPVVGGIEPEALTEGLMREILGWLGSGRGDGGYHGLRNHSGAGAGNGTIATSDIPNPVLEAWLGRLGTLVEDVRTWAQELGWSTREVKKAMDESSLGPYLAPALVLQKGTTRMFLEPHGHSAWRAEGVVDLYPMPCYADVARIIYFDHSWRLIPPAVLAKLVDDQGPDPEPISKEGVRALLEKAVRDGR